MDVFYVISVISFITKNLDLEVQNSFVIININAKLMQKQSPGGVQQKGVFLRVLQNLQEKASTRIVYFLKNFAENETLTHVFCWKCYKIFKNTYTLELLVLFFLLKQCFKFLVSLVISLIRGWCSLEGETYFKVRNMSNENLVIFYFKIRTKHTFSLLNKI